MSIDEKTLKQIADELQRGFTDMMFATLEKYMAGTPRKAEASSNSTSKPTFPDELAALVTTEDAGTVWHVKPVKYLGSENFSLINDIVKQYGGRYLKAMAPKQAGKWEIPKKASA